MPSSPDTRLRRGSWTEPSSNFHPGESGSLLHPIYPFTDCRVPPRSRSVARCQQGRNRGWAGCVSFCDSFQNCGMQKVSSVCTPSRSMPSRKSSSPIGRLWRFPSPRTWHPMRRRFNEALLNACQLDAGRIAVEMSTLDLVAVIEKVVDEIQPTAALSRTLLHVDLERPLMVRGDARRLWQICWNLLTNCIQFASPNGEVQIQAYNGASTVKLCVRDNGIGISQDQLPHIFERFRQGHTPQLKSYSGLGLGLAIVKDLVILHGGTIVAESAGPGKGACFTVTLP